MERGEYFIVKVHNLVNKILHLQIRIFSRFTRLGLGFLFFMLSYRIKLILSPQNKLRTYSSHLYLFRDIIMFSTDGQTLLNHHILIRGSRIYILYRVVSGE